MLFGFIKILQDWYYPSNLPYNENKQIWLTESIDSSLDSNTVTIQFLNNSIKWDICLLSSYYMRSKKINWFSGHPIAAL